MYGSGDYRNGDYQARPPSVSFDALSEAWRLFSAQMGTWALAVFVAGLCGCALFGALYSVFCVTMMAFFGLGLKGSDTGPVVCGLCFLGIALIVAFFCLAGIFQGGLYRMALKQVRGQAIGVGDIFDGFRFAGPLSIATLLEYLAEFAVMWTVIGGPILRGLWMVTSFLVMEQKLSAMEAMRRSWNALKADLAMAAVLMFVVYLVVWVSAWFLVGTLFTAPLLYLVPALIYRDFFDQERVAGTRPVTVAPVAPSPSSFDL